jgi:hypothetical protein
MMLTTRRYPIWYLPITKCGCTWLKNLFYFLDHDRPYPEPQAIHSDPDALLRAGDVEPGFIAGSRFVFAVVRDPAERFLSLYFDKIWRDGPGNFPRLRALIADEAGLDLSHGLDPEGHRRNCLALIGWLARNLAGETAEPVNPHWRRQSARLRRARAMAPVLLTLDGLDRQLPAFLGPAVPGIAKAMAAVRERNASPRPVPTAEVLTPALRERVAEVYRDDAALVRRARADWQRRHAAGWTSAAPDRTRPEAGAPFIRLLSTHRYPIFALAVPGCGRTVFHTLCHFLDHGRLHPDPAGIEADGCLVHVRAGAGDHGGRGFLVIRDPVARFLALYATQVLRTGPRAFPGLARRAAEGPGLRRGEGLGTEEHRDNCLNLVAIIAEDLARLPASKVTGLWRPQTAYAERARPFGLRALDFDDLDRQLVRHLGDLVPGLGPAIARVRAVLPPEETGLPEGLVDRRLESAILAVYGPDRDLHARVSAHWAATGQAPTV